MDGRSYLRWLEGIDLLSAGQRAEVGVILQGRPAESEVIATLEQGILADRVCPRCHRPGLVCRGRANGLRRFRCAGCARTCNAVTGTPLARLRYKGRWLDFAQSLSAGETVRKGAARCVVAASTSFRWRHRFLRLIKTDVARLTGIVEADETYVLKSDKGSRAWKAAAASGTPGAAAPPARKPRKRGGKAAQRGLSAEQVPILIAADRTGATVSARLPAATAEAIAAVLAPVLGKDALLVTDAAKAYPACAAMLGVTHEVLNRSAGERVRGDLHIQTVNSRHERFKTFLRRFRGVATKYLPSYLKWFHLSGIHIDPTPRACLNAAMGRA